MAEGGTKTKLTMASIFFTKLNTQDILAAAWVESTSTPSSSLQHIHHISIHVLYYHDYNTHSCIICRATYDCQSRVKLKFTGIVCTPYSPKLSCTPKMNVRGWTLGAIVRTVQVSVAAMITSGCLCLYWYQQWRDQTITGGRVGLY